MRLLNTLICLIAITGYLKAQDCVAYIPHEEGTKLEITSYDKKGNVTSVATQEITKVEIVGNTTTFVVHQKVTDVNGEEPIEGDLTFKCVDNVFYVDMSSFMSNEQMESFEGMDMEVEMDEIDIPSNYTPGQQLKDGKITMKLVGDSPIPMNFTVEVVNRKVEGKEKITTSAGTFDCIKISQDIISKMGFTIRMNSVEWYAEGIGAVKTETYKKDKLIGSTELTKIEKP